MWKSKERPVKECDNSLNSLIKASKYQKTYVAMFFSSHPATLGSGLSGLWRQQSIQPVASLWAFEKKEHTLRPQATVM